MADSDEMYIVQFNCYVDKETKKMKTILSSEGNEIKLSENSIEDLAKALIPKPANKMEKTKTQQKKPRKRTKPKTDQKGLDQLEAEIEEYLKKDETKVGVDWLRKALGAHQDFHRLRQDPEVNLLAHGKWTDPPNCWPKESMFIDPNNGSQDENGGKIKPKKEFLVSMYKTFKDVYNSIQGKNSQPVERKLIICEQEAEEETGYPHIDILGINRDNMQIFNPNGLQLDSGYTALLDQLEGLHKNSTDHPGLCEQLTTIIQLMPQRCEDQDFLQDISALVGQVEATKQENWSVFSTKCQHLLERYWLLEPQMAAGTSTSKVRKRLAETATTDSNALNIDMRVPLSEASEIFPGMMSAPVMPVMPTMEMELLKKPNTGGSGDEEAGNRPSDMSDGKQYASLETFQPADASYNCDMFKGGDVLREEDVAVANLGKIGYTFNDDTFDEIALFDGNMSGFDIQLFENLLQGAA